MLKYDSFILESKLEEILNEGNLVFSNKFINLISAIDNPISSYLISNSNIKCDVNANFIDLGSKSDTASFTQENRLELHDVVFKVINRYRIADGSYSIVKRAGFDTNGLVKYIDDNKFRLINSASLDSLKMYHLQFISDDSKYLIVYQFNDDLSPVIMPISDLKGDSEIKIGRLVTKIINTLGGSFKDKDVEDFVNKYKASYDSMNNIEDNFKIVKGEDIRKYYSKDNYYKDSKSEGTQLWKSCMSSNYCQSFLDIYVENPDNINMLVLLKDGKVLGRALLWNLDDGNKFMDRIYTISDSYIFNIEKWGKENGYIIFSELKSYTLEVTLKPEVYGSYPYMDTFKYYDSSTGFITNDSDLYDNDFIMLSETDGGWS